MGLTTKSFDGPPAGTAADRNKVVQTTGTAVGLVGRTESFSGAEANDTATAVPPERK
jgi:hypothetical protein